MYHIVMKKIILKKKLLKHYAESTVRSLLNGSRLPSMKEAIKLNQKERIPFNAWVDIRSYVNNTKSKGATTSLQKEVS